MKASSNTYEPIATDALYSAAQEAIRQARSETPHAYLLDAKFGNATTEPTPDTVIAATHQTPPSSLGYRLTQITTALKEADRRLGNPLHEIAGGINDVVSRAAIVNRHNRQPPLYAESTIRVLVKLGFATPPDSPLIRAAGYIAHLPSSLTATT